MPATVKELLSHVIVQAALGVVALILVGSVAYYLVESRPPALGYAQAAVGDVTEDVVGSGTVSPVQNPDLAFQTGGRVSYVGVKVGQKVAAGTLLASLDTGVLGAQAAAAQANLEGVAAGPRPVDLAGKQTAVASAQTTLDNTYAALPATLRDAQSKAETAVYTDADPFLTSLNAADHPRPAFTSNNGTAAEQAGIERQQLKNEFDAWEKELSSFTPATSTAGSDAMLASSIAHLNAVRQFFDDFVVAANSAYPALSQSELASITGGRASVNAAILALTQEQQTISGQKLSVQSAQDALTLVQAGATQQTIDAARAQAQAAQALLAQAQIVAPFSGTVASVQVKAGDVVSQNQSAVALIPDGGFEVDVYLSEVDATKLVAGDPADVTLDAYGPAVVFPASVGSVDSAPTMVNGAPSYKATLVFAKADARIATGMHANATIHAGAKQGVVTVPSSAVITDTNATYVLKREGGASVKTPVTVGLIGTSTVEIVAGVSAGDTVAIGAGGGAASY